MPNAREVLEHLDSVKKKPPLGVMPKDIWDMKRANELGMAIQRYIAEGFVIPSKWVEEYNDLMRGFNND